MESARVRAITARRPGWSIHPPPGFRRRSRQDQVAGPRKPATWMHGRSVLHSAGDGVEDEWRQVARIAAAEVEHSGQRAGDPIETTGDPRQAPVVLDEAD